MAYTSDITSLPPIDGVQMAPEVAAGDLLSNLDISKSRRDVLLTEQLRNLGKATDEQVGESDKRHGKIVAQHIPGWSQTAPGLHATLQQIQHQIQLMQHQLQLMQHQLQPMQHQLQLITDSQLVNEARNKNSQSRKRNKLVETNRLDVVMSLAALVKEEAGTGPMLPGNHEHLPIPDVAVGEQVPEHFPQTLDELYALTHSRLEYLSRVFNNDFGIQAADGISRRILKFRWFISDY